MPDSDGFALGPLPGTNMVEYGFPLRTEQFAYLTLPRDITSAEVRRLVRFLEVIERTSPKGVA